MLFTLLAQYMLRQVSPLPEGSAQPPWIQSGRLGDWHLLGSIGRGSFGEVFLAEDAAGTRKALKVFAPRNDSRAAFDLEYDGMELAYHRMKKHPHLVPVESIGRTEYCIYYIMPPADALAEDPYTPHTLHNRIQRNDLAEAELLELTDGVLDALAFLHGQKLVHRDIKPDNILKISGRWCLGDLGLLARNRPKHFAGTPGFYPPKKSYRADPSGDLYALGKTLYCAATGMKAENYPLVPGHYDYSRFPEIRRLYRNAVEGRYPAAEAMRGDMKAV